MKRSQNIYCLCASMVYVKSVLTFVLLGTQPLFLFENLKQNKKNWGRLLCTRLTKNVYFLKIFNFMGKLMKFGNFLAGVNVLVSLVLTKNRLFLELFFIEILGQALSSISRGDRALHQVTH